MSNPHHPKNAPTKSGYFYYMGLGLPTPVFFAIQALTIWALYHAIRTRTVEDYLVYGGAIALPVMILLLTVWWKSGSSRSRRSMSAKLFGLYLIPGAALVGALYYSLLASAYDLLIWLMLQWYQPYAGPTIVSLLVLMIGCVLFWFRTKCRVTYGLTEVLVGVCIASYKYLEAAHGVDTVGAADVNLLIVLLTAGVYLVVRGLDNIQQGLRSTPIDPIIRPLLSWYGRLGEVSIDIRKQEEKNRDD